MSVWQLVFGNHPDWLPLIAARLDRSLYRASFAPLDSVDLAAFDAVLPLSIADYHALAGGVAPPGRRFLHPPLEIADLCDDKLSLARFLTERGFGRAVPRLLDRADAFYPRVRRPRRSEFGRGARILIAAEEGPASADDFDQAFIPGTDEYALHVLRVDGAITFSWALHYTMAAPDLIRGERHMPATVGEIDPAPALARFAPMLDALGYAGTCCIDFKVFDGDFYLLELNPRFGGSLALNVNRYVAAYLGALTP